MARKAVATITVVYEREAHDDDIAGIEQACWDMIDAHAPINCDMWSESYRVEVENKEVSDEDH